MKIIAYLFIVFSLSAYAVENVKDKVQDLLPLPIKNFKINLTNLSQVEKQLGRPNLVEGKSRYWEKDGLKYALKLTFNDKNYLTSLHYTFTNSPPQIDKLGKIDSKSLTPFPLKGSSAGRYFMLRTKGSEVVIDPISKTIYSIEIL